MTHRTSTLPEASGFSRQFRELRYHEATRQSSGFLFLILMSLLGRTDTLLWGVGAPLVVLGTAVRLWASGHVMKNKQLAVSGPYARVRHPLYTGNILVLLGFATAAGLWWGWTILAAMIWTFYPTAVEYEDRKLHGLFGDTWLAWSKRTPAILPRLRGADAGDSSWSFQQSLRKNGEPVIALVVCALYLLLLWRAS